jgi:type IV secretion system protein VirB5
MKKTLWGFCFLSLSVGYLPSAKADDITKIIHLLSDISGTQEEMQAAQQIMSEYEQIMSGNTTLQYELSEKAWDELTKNYNVTRPTDHAFSFDQSSTYTELWSPDEYKDAVVSASGGNSERYQEIKDNYAQANRTLVETPASAIDNEKLIASSYTQKAQDANTALASSDYSYGDINQRIKNLQDLLERVDKTDAQGKPVYNPNEKSAIDLNTRMVAESALIQAEILRLETIRTHMEASHIQDQVNHETMGKKLLGVNVSQ